MNQIYDASAKGFYLPEKRIPLYFIPIDRLSYFEWY